MVLVSLIQDGLVAGAETMDMISWRSVADRKKNCPECETILHELENIDDDSEKLGIDFVKIEDDKLLKTYGGKKAPALVYFRKRAPTLYTGRAFLTVTNAGCE